MSRFLIRTFVVVAAVTRVAAAQTATSNPGPAPLTINAAVSEAQARNAELIALRQEYEVARAAPARERVLSASLAALL